MSSVAEWLDATRAGFGAKFSQCFESCGAEDVADLADLDEEAMDALESTLKAAGALPIHLSKIRAAIRALSAEANTSASALVPRRPEQPSPSKFTPRQNSNTKAVLRNADRRFACFLSHHKQACAAEARLVKQQLESMLDAKVFSGKWRLQPLALSHSLPGFTHTPSPSFPHHHHPQTPTSSTSASWLPTSSPQTCSCSSSPRRRSRTRGAFLRCTRPPPPASGRRTSSSS